VRKEHPQIVDYYSHIFNLERNIVVIFLEGKVILNYNNNNNKKNKKK